MKAYLLPQKALLLQNNVGNFLQGLSCHTAQAPQNAFVDIKGRVIATCTQKALEHDCHLLVTASQAHHKLYQHLQKYARLSKTQITILNHLCYHIETNSAETIDNNDQEEWLMTQQGLSGQKAGSIWVGPGTSHFLTQLSLSSTQEFNLFRLQHEWPLQGIDYNTEMLLNIHPEHFVSFQKGCFLGQEVLARVHHKAQAPRKLVVLTQNNCPSHLQPKMTSLTTDPQTGQALGFVFISNSKEVSQTTGTMTKDKH